MYYLNTYGSDPRDRNPTPAVALLTIQASTLHRHIRHGTMHHADLAHLFTQIYRRISLRCHEHIIKQMVFVHPMHSRLVASLRYDERFFVLSKRSLQRSFFCTDKIHPNKSVWITCNCMFSRVFGIPIFHLSGPNGVRSTQSSPLCRRF